MSTAACLTWDQVTIFRGRCYRHGRPQLRDPSDELVLEAVVSGQALMIVTFNKRDVGTVPARFGLVLLTPAEAIRKIRK
jgi:predicted nucleic acid-binding protein